MLYVDYCILYIVYYILYVVCCISYLVYCILYAVDYIQYNMLPADENNDVQRTAMTNATVRSIFLIDPEKKIRMMLTYPMTTGRNFNEIIRVLDSVQLSSKKKVATPANWTRNDEVIIIPAVTDEDAKEMFGEFRKVNPYLRYTKINEGT